MSRPYLGPIDLILGGATLAIGIAYSLTSRGASFAENKLSDFADTHPTSYLTRISTVFSNTLQMSGSYALFLGIVATFMGTLKLSFYILEKTKYNTNSVAIVGAFALASVAALGAYWVGMPNVTKLQGG